MTFDDVRQIGLKLPRTSETRYYRMPALKVDDEVFAVQTSHPSAEPKTISVPVGYNRRDELIKTKPKLFYLKPHYEPYPVVLVRLDKISRSELQRLLRAAYDAVASGAVVPGRRRTTKRPKRQT
jgi:hypothetical protein